MRYHHYTNRYIMDLLAMEGVGTALEGQQRKRQRSLDSSSELDGTLEHSSKKVLLLSIFVAYTF
jgi:hypothetical protein